MNIGMKAFLLDLADLMEKHKIDEIEAVDDGANYYPSVDGIQFNVYGQESERLWASLTAKDIRVWVNDIIVKETK